MFNRIKNIFKKSENGSRNWISFLGNYLWNTSIRDNEYVKFFTGRQYAAITAIADSISGLNYRLSDGHDKQINHEYLDFVTPDLIQNIAIFMKMTWTAYVRKVMAGNKVIWLDMLIPRNISPVIDTNWNLQYRNYVWNGKSIRLEKEEVMVFAEFNPYERYPYITRGYSPIQAIAMTIRGEKEIEDWNYSLLTNDVPPGMVLTTDQALTEDQVKAIKSNWEANHTGAKNVGKLAILPFWIKPNNVQASPKEMDFVAQQNWDRDKILAIYKVPKAILWIWEGVNVWNVKSFNQIYSTRCIEPLTKKITRVLNDNLFNWIGIFEFLNVLPTDEEAVREHYLSWGITRNEYRQELWYNPVKWGDVFYDWTVCHTIEDNKKSDTYSKINFKSIVESNIPRSEKRMIKRWENKQVTYRKYEAKLKEWLLKIFNKEEKAIMKEFEEKKWFNPSNKALKLKLERRFYALYYLYLKDTVEEIVKSEGSRAMNELEIERAFNYNEKTAKKVKEMLTILAKDVDSVTDSNLLNAIWEAVDQGLPPNEVKEVLEEVFSDLKTYRLNRIIRSESIRYWTFAEQEAREQSWIVKYKQRWTAIDERVCDSCWALHWKKIPLKENFFDKWDKFNWLKLDYEDVIGSPLHPNCRCDMIPIT